jgi:hypothetical protein
MADLEMYRGDDASFNIAVQKDGAPVDLSGATLRFTAKRGRLEPDADAVLSKSTAGGGGITITDAPGGIARVDVLPADTDALARAVRLVWDLQAVDAASKVRTLATGRLVIHADVTRSAP